MQDLTPDSTVISEWIDAATVSESKPQMCCAMPDAQSSVLTSLRAGVGVLDNVG